MSDYLRSLIQRHLATPPGAVRPRLPSRWEPQPQAGAGAAFPAGLPAESTVEREASAAMDAEEGSGRRAQGGPESTVTAARNDGAISSAADGTEAGGAARARRARHSPDAMDRAGEGPAEDRPVEHDGGRSHARPGTLSPRPPSTTRLSGPAARASSGETSNAMPAGDTEGPEPTISPPSGARGDGPFAASPGPPPVPGSRAATGPSHPGGAAGPNAPMASSTDAPPPARRTRSATDAATDAAARGPVGDTPGMVPSSSFSQRDGDANGSFARPGEPADAAEPPVIRVTIGRVDVRAEKPAPRSPTPPATPRAPLLSLSEYLKQRREGRR